METIKKNYKAFGWGLIGFALYSMLTLYIGEGFTYWLIGIPFFIGFVILILGAKYGWGKTLPVLLFFLGVPLLMQGQEADVVINADYSSWMLVAAGLIGILIHVVSKIRDRFSNDQEKLTWDRFANEPDWVRHILNSFFAILVVVVAVIFKDDIQSVFPVVPLTMLGVGYQADSLWKNWTKFKEKEHDA